MTYMVQDVYQKAIKFAGAKHSKQLVPGTDSNYLLHLSNVAMEVMVAYLEESSFDIELAVQIALLHDSLEDSDTTFEELKEHFGKQVAEGVQALTKDSSLETKEERMRDSLNRIKKSYKETGIVKLADRITNLQEPPVHWDKNKRIKYLAEAKLILLELPGRSSYLESRLQGKIENYNLYI